MDNIYHWLQSKGFEVTPCEEVETAFFHSSYINEHKSCKENNERLEFVGDAVLQIYTTTRLYQIQPSLDEGQMTLFRSKLVSEPALAGYVRKLGINRYLKLGVGEEKTGGRERDSILADLFEAFVGALYLTCGFAVVFQFLEMVIGSMFENPKKILQDDYKTRLQEFIQSDSRKTVQYEVVHTSGPSNAPLFEVVVKLDDRILAEGKGTSKKRAEQEAAKNALLKIAR